MDVFTRNSREFRVQDIVFFGLVYVHRRDPRLSRRFIPAEEVISGPLQCARLKNPFVSFDSHITPVTLERRSRSGPGYQPGAPFM